MLLSARQKFSKYFFGMINGGDEGLKIGIEACKVCEGMHEQMQICGIVANACRTAPPATQTEVFASNGQSHPNIFFINS